MNMRDAGKRGVFLFFGIVVGLIMAFCLSFVWIVIKGYILGYGDSGPEWINTVTDWIQYLTIITCAILSQVVFHYQKKGSEKENINVR